MTTSETQVEEKEAAPVPQAVAEDERCPTCGASVPPGFRFCGKCGRALAATFAPVPGDVVTIAFVDLVGYTSFASRVDDDEVRELIRIFHGLVREQIGRHGGFEVKQMGDGFMIAFSSPKRAVACTADIQRAVASGVTAGPASTIQVSAGLNSGAAIREGDDFFGHTVNAASRIADRAGGGQIFMAESTRSLAGDVDGARFRDLGRRRLRDIEGRHRLFEVLWRE